jgi:hypothetical protein
VALGDYGFAPVLSGASLLATFGLRADRVGPDLVCLAAWGVLFASAAACALAVRHGW